MTEAEWLKDTNEHRLYYRFPEVCSRRKLRLLSCSCCRQVWGLLEDERSRQAVVAMERHADGLIPRRVLRAAKEAAEMAAKESFDRSPIIDPPQSLAASAAARAADDHDKTAEVIRSCQYTASDYRLSPEQYRAAEEAVNVVQRGLIRDIFGNPFRPVAIDPTWRTPSALALATAAYEERLMPSGHLEPDRLAILADALEDAGCDNPVVLAHFHSPGPHCRGCWPLDAILGRS
jgi:hypothetical protein